MGLPDRQAYVVLPANVPRGKIRLYYPYEKMDICLSNIFIKLLLFVLSCVGINLKKIIKSRAKETISISKNHIRNIKLLPIHQEIDSVINVSDINEYQETSVFGSIKGDKDTKIENKSIKEVQKKPSDKSIKTKTKKELNEQSLPTIDNVNADNMQKNIVQDKFEHEIY